MLALAHSSGGAFAPAAGAAADVELPAERERADEERQMLTKSDDTQDSDVVAADGKEALARRHTAVGLAVFVLALLYVLLGQGGSDAVQGPTAAAASVRAQTVTPPAAAAAPSSRSVGMASTVATSTAGHGDDGDAAAAPHRSPDGSATPPPPSAAAPRGVASMPSPSPPPPPPPAPSGPPRALPPVPPPCPPPPQAPPPLPMSASERVARLNSLILTGGAPAQLQAAQKRASAHGGQATLNAAAGVWIRQDDGMADGERPWKPCVGAGSWCSGMADRWPASILNWKHPGTWSENQYGLVLEASLVRSRCAYAGDGASMGQGCRSRADVDAGTRARAAQRRSAQIPVPPAACQVHH